MLCVVAGCSQVQQMAARRKDTVCVSGQTGEGVEQLLEVITTKLNESMTLVRPCTCNCNCSLCACGVLVVSGVASGGCKWVGVVVLLVVGSGGGLAALLFW